MGKSEIRILASFVFYPDTKPDEAFYAASIAGEKAYLKLSLAEKICFHYWDLMLRRNVHRSICGMPIYLS